MARIDMMITIKRAWWVIPYLQAVLWFRDWTGLEPDVEKVTGFALRGFTWSID